MSEITTNYCRRMGCAILKVTKIHGRTVRTCGITGKIPGNMPGCPKIIEAIKGRIEWGNGEPCPICKRPFEKPDIDHLVSHPEAQEMLFRKKGVRA